MRDKGFSEEHTNQWLDSVNDKSESDRTYEQVGNYTKFKLVEMLIEKYKGKDLNSMNAIEKLSEDILKVLSVCGMKFYQKLHNEFGNSEDS